MICLRITYISQDISILYFHMVHLIERCMIKHTPYLPKMHSALLVKSKMHVSLQIHKMFRIRKMIMNPECILYKSCKLFNASWRLKRFEFLYLLGIVFVWWQKSHGQKVAAAKCKMHGTEKRGKFSILMATANLYSLT